MKTWILDTLGDYFYLAVFITTAVVAVIAIAVAGAAYEAEHPCLRYGAPHEVWFQPPPIWVGTMMVPQPGYPYTERLCVERKP